MIEKKIWAPLCCRNFPRVEDARVTNRELQKKRKKGKKIHLKKSKKKGKKTLGSSGPCRLNSFFWLVLLFFFVRFLSIDFLFFPFSISVFLWFFLAFPRHPRHCKIESIDQSKRKKTNQQERKTKKRNQQNWIGQELLGEELQRRRKSEHSFDWSGAFRGGASRRRQKIHKFSIGQEPWWGGGVVGGARLWLVGFGAQEHLGEESATTTQYVDLADFDACDAVAGRHAHKADHVFVVSGRDHAFFDTVTPTPHLISSSFFFINQYQNRWPQSIKSNGTTSKFGCSKKKKCEAHLKKKNNPNGYRLREGSAPSGMRGTNEGIHR